MELKDYKNDIKNTLAAFKNVKSIELKGEQLLHLSLSMSKLMSALEDLIEAEKEIPKEEPNAN